MLYDERILCENGRNIFIKLRNKFKDNHKLEILVQFLKMLIYIYKNYNKKIYITNCPVIT